MEENIQQAQSELVSPVEETPKSLEEIIGSLRGFGIEDFEEILTVEAGGKKVRLRISNIPTQDEMMALLATEEFKGYAWVQRIKCEILSRSISWIDGVSIRNLEPTQRFITDPIDKIQKDVQVVLRNVIIGWGQEMVGVLWKVLMVHSQRIEDRLQNAFPDSAIMTEVEKRFMEQALREIEETSKVVIEDTVAKIFEEDSKPEEAKS
jgi:hypothetical protein